MRIIAYYLPQFHEIPENNEWWGDGFTEWTNVRKAKPFFRGHDQPKIPGELGYYDLKDSVIREKQAILAKNAGIGAFCYWHYWFGNGKQLLELPFNAVLNSNKPDFGFCLGWANESWKAKVWSDTTGNEDKILIEQKYPGKEDIEKHFYHVLKAFKDNRYIKVDGKPLFVIYRPKQLPDAKEFIGIWNKLAMREGLKGVFFVGHTLYSSEIDSILKLDFDAVNVVRLGDCRRSKKLFLINIGNLVLFALGRKPFVYSYKNAISELIGNENNRSDVFPSIIPNWDHTPRSGKHGFVLQNSTPSLFKRHAEQVLESVKNKPDESQIVFLKSWNEWGEGNYIEPDEKYEKEYLNILSKISRKY
jgi:hypothetical protein